MLAANEFMIGADPEFAILHSSGDYVSAALPQGKLGTDHGGRVVELRPDPSRSAAAICADIYRTLSRHELDPYRRYKWKAGAMAGSQPIGGHIHFDVPYDPLDPKLRVLDRMVEWFNHLELFPQIECRVRRSYGYGGANTDSHHRRAGRRPDGGSRLEFRTPPSWLWSPDIAHLTLSAFKLSLVDPDHTLSTLQSPDIRPVLKFRDFFRSFAERDSDAAELAPRLAKRGSLEQFRGDPLGDLKEAWGLAAPEPVEVAKPASRNRDAAQYYSQAMLDNLASISPLRR